MRGLGKRLDSNRHRAQRRFHEAPLAPPAGNAPLDQHDRGIALQGGLHELEVLRLRPAVEMDRHEVACRCQALGLGDDAIRVLVAQKKVGDLCHSKFRGVRLWCFLFLS